jgi:hypothetical protein
MNQFLVKMKKNNTFIYKMNNYVFIIDLDGTIIGDCVYQAEIYKISLILNKLKIKIKINDILEDAYKERTRMIRPYFKFFIEKMKEYYPSSYFYIYTASEKRWAEKEIKIIEKVLKIKFNRPIFTRNDCEIIDNGIKKSIEIIKKKIKIKNPEILIIDDNNVYMDYNENLVKCSIYNYKFFCNYWEYIPIEKIGNKIVLKYLKSLISNNRLSPIIEKKTMKEKINYYDWLYQKCNEVNKGNKQCIKDKFWLNLTKILIENKILSFNTSTVKFINNKIAEQVVD